MDLPDALHDALEAHLDAVIHDVIAVSGGCIANACRLETDDDPLFLKWGDHEVARTFPGEAAGLEALAAAESDLHVPEVQATDEPTGDRPGFLSLAWINTGRQGRRFWEDFGRGLARLHRTTADRYGFDRDNFIGRLPQSNTWADSWPEFFRRERLEPQVNRARENDRWKAAWDSPLEQLDRRLDDLLPAEPPASVLHGDLWKGNFMVTAIGEPALIDPATYHGHREADLAMTELFGGFEPPFYKAYRDAWPLESDYDERREIYNLYHLINHLNHFGAGYANSVASTLNRFA